MSTEIAIREYQQQLAEKLAETNHTFTMAPRNLEEAMRFAEIMAKSDLVPKDYRDKPGNILVAIQMGSEIGMTPMRALRSIAVINGRASMWGDDMLAMVLASPVCEYVYEHESTDTKGVCRVKRKNEKEEHTSTFGVEDAKRAGLLGKGGSWQTFHPRMLKLRARGFALRDKFADVLAGLITREEAMDLPQEPIAEVVTNRIDGPTRPLTLKEKLKQQVEDKAAVLQEQEPASSVDPVTEAETSPTAAPPPDLPSIDDLTHRMRGCESIKEWAEVENGALQIKEQNACTAGEWTTYRAVSDQKKKVLTGKK